MLRYLHVHTYQLTKTAELWVL